MPQKPLGRFTIVSGDEGVSGTAGSGSEAERHKDPIDRAINGIQRLQGIYRLERSLFLGGGLLSLIFSTVIAIMTLIEKEATLANMLPLLGSSGAFMATGAGSMYYFGKSFDLLRELAGAASHE